MVHLARRKNAQKREFDQIFKYGVNAPHPLHR